METGRPESEARDRGVKQVSTYKPEREWVAFPAKDLLPVLRRMGCLSSKTKNVAPDLAAELAATLQKRSAQLDLIEPELREAEQRYDAAEVAHKVCFCFFIGGLSPPLLARIPHSRFFFLS